MNIAFVYCYRIRNLITRREFTEYLISNSEFTGFGFHFKCYINGVRRNDIFKGICIKFFIFAFLNIFTVHLNGINDISVICCDCKCLIVTISYFHLISSIRNSAVGTCGCCDGGVEICIDFVVNRISCYFPICCQTINRNCIISFSVRDSPFFQFVSFITKGIPCCYYKISTIS